MASMDMGNSVGCAGSRVGVVVFVCVTVRSGEGVTLNVTVCVAVGVKVNVEVDVAVIVEVGVSVTVGLGLGRLVNARRGVFLGVGEMVFVGWGGSGEAVIRADVCPQALKNRARESKARANMDHLRIRVSPSFVLWFRL